MANKNIISLVVGILLYLFWWCLGGWMLTNFFGNGAFIFYGALTLIVGGLRDSGLLI
jgi:hypothetical protein